MKFDIGKLDDKKLAKLVENRWASSSTIWEKINQIYAQNTAIYENKAEWVNRIPVKRVKVQANRVFVNMEAVINALIANPATINFIPTRPEDPVAENIAKNQESFFQEKFKEINFKETQRMALRNLYFGRLLVIKSFWNNKINDFDFRALDPRKVRIADYAKNEEESEFVIEEVEDTALAVCYRFPDKKEELLKRLGTTEDDLYIKNPKITYKEAWIGDYLICKYEDIILKKIKNPYFDWDGILVTSEEKEQLDSEYDSTKRRELFNEIRLQQGERKLPPNEGHSEEIRYEAYYFNYFNQPRKPYIFATILNNENSPIGRTDFITLVAPLQESIDKRKQDIDANCELVNGIIKVDSQVMSKDDAQSLRFEAKGIIWGKNVSTGVSRETGTPLPEMVFNDMLDSRSEIDNIMAANSAFRGEREGQETKAGRLALIEQSFQRLNELVQVVDFVSGEAFKWAYQLAKTRYTEEHYAKWVGKDTTLNIRGFMQDDFITGTEIRVIPGKTLPQDAQFRFERAQKDVETGVLSPVDYMNEAGYSNPKQLAQNAVLYKQNPAIAVGLEELPPAEQPGQPTEAQRAQEQQQEMDTFAQQKMIESELTRQNNNVAT